MLASEAGQRVVAAPTHLPAVTQDVTAAVLAIALGTQNAVVRTLAVPDLTTTVLTLTLTGLVADARHGLNSTSLRRLLAVTAMLAGAIAGAVLVLDVSPAAGLAATTAVLVAVVTTASALSRTNHAWHQPTG